MLQVEARAFLPPTERMTYLWTFVRQTTVHKELARESGKLGPGTAPFTLRFRSEPERAAYLNTVRLKLESKSASLAAGTNSTHVQLSWETEERVVNLESAYHSTLIRCGAFELLVSDETR